MMLDTEIHWPHVPGFLVIALLYQNIQCWNKMIHVMCTRVHTYGRQFKNWVKQLPTSRRPR
jgi:hypothetical protein